MPASRVPRFREAAVAIRLVLPALLLAPILSGGTPAPAPPKAPRPIGCAADLEYPIRVTVSPLGSVRGGSPLSARIEVTSTIPIEDVQVRLVPAAGVTVLAPPAAAFGLLRAGEARSASFTVLPAGGAPRRTVRIVVEGMVDGERIATEAVLNLVFDEEPRRLVTDPSGETVIEVVGRRIG